MLGLTFEISDVFFGRNLLNTIKYSNDHGRVHPYFHHNFLPNVDKIFSWGDDEAVVRDYANYGGTSGFDKWECTSPVGSFKPTGYGLHDMWGNASEWGQDWYNSDQKYRVLRGGSWFNSTYYLRAAYRNLYLPTLSCNFFGFRCVSGF